MEVFESGIITFIQYFIFFIALFPALVSVSLAFCIYQLLKIEKKPILIMTLFSIIFLEYALVLHFFQFNSLVGLINGVMSFVFLAFIIWYLKYSKITIQIKSKKNKKRLIITLGMTVVLFFCFLFLNSLDSRFINEEAKVLFDKASECETNEDLKKSLDYLNKADQIEPNSPLILFERGVLKTRLDKLDDGIIDINKAINLTHGKKEKKKLYYHRAEVYSENNEMEKACLDWRRSGEYGKESLKFYCKSCSTANTMH